MKILIVDDSALGRSYITKALSMAGIDKDRVIEAVNGQDAFDLCQKTESQVACIFLDINMPVMNGLELVDKMEKNGMMKKIQVIMTSSLADQNRMEILKQQGVRYFLRKPFTPESLKEILDVVSR